MQTYYFIGLTLWLVLFIAGKRQFAKLRENTIDLVLAEVEPARLQNSDLTVEDYYEMIFPQWEDMVSHTAWFVPHKTELWPMPATPKYLQTRMNFTPAWMGAFLKTHHIELDCSPEIRDEINVILSQYKEKERAS